MDEKLKEKLKKEINDGRNFNKRLLDGLKLRLKFAQKVKTAAEKDIRRYKDLITKSEKQIEKYDSLEKELEN